MTKQNSFSRFLAEKIQDKFVVVDRISHPYRVTDKELKDVIYRAIDEWESKLERTTK